MEDTSNFKQDNQYSLSIRFSSDGFSLLVHDKADLLVSSKKVTVPLFSLAKNEIVSVLEQEVERLLNYIDIRIVCELDDYVFVPTPLFEVGNEIDFLLLEHKIEKKDCAIYNKITTWNTVNIFSIPKNFRAALTQLFHNSAIEHHLSFFLTDQVKHRNESSVQILVRPNTMDVVVLINGNLQLINSYTYNTPEDFTYYTLNLFDQLSLDTETCKVRLFNVGSSIVLQRMIQKYVKQVEVIS